MPYICTTVTSLITQTVFDPVTDWVNQTQQQCSGKWWNPFCWFVTIVVAVTIWIAREILVPIFQVVCSFVSWIIYWAASTVGINLPFFQCEKVTFVSRTKSTSNASAYHYVFDCNCDNCAYSEQIEVEADNDDAAALIAKDKCQAAC